jgi:hypothetical protein
MQHFFFLLPLTRELASILEHRVDYSVPWSFTGGRIPLTGDQPIAKPLPKYRTTQIQKKKKKTWTYIKHPCPMRDSNPQLRLPSDRRLFIFQNARLPRPATMQHKKVNSVALVRKQIIRTERPPLVGEFSTNYAAYTIKIWQNVSLRFLILEMEPCLPVTY